MIHQDGSGAGRRGSGVLLALGVTLLLSIVIIGVRSFSSYRIQNTITESRNVKALALAEAGLAAVITELSNNFSFKTHTIQPTSLAWGTPSQYTPTLQAESGHRFSILTTSGGTYHGKLGDGEFKVRCGQIPYQDDPRTKNINEQFAFYKVEAMGRVNDSVRFVEAIVKRHYPGRQFLMYDGDVLSIVYGRPNDYTGINMFSTGHLYGHKRVEIGRILLQNHSSVLDGTRQELRDIDFLISGAGHLFFYSPITAQFRAKDGVPEFWSEIPKNTSYPTNGQYTSAEHERKGELAKELQNHEPPIPDNLKGHIKDVNARVSIPPRPIGWEGYKAKATSGGIYFSDADCSTAYPVTPGWTGPSGASSVNVKILDFGTQIRPGTVNLPAGFNGTIYADGNLVIKGNPPCDINIVSRKNVFVAGDFNQRGDGNGPERYCFPQNYQRNALEDNDYIQNSRDLLLDDATGGFQHHQAAEILAEERLIFDYRSPIDCFENELYPYMKYKIAALLRDDATARQNVLKSGGSGDFQSDTADENEVKTKLEPFFTNYPIGDTVKKDALIQKFADYRLNQGKIFRNNEFDQLCREVWLGYREKYESQKLNSGFGVYTLLNALDSEWNSNPQDQADDYLYAPEMTTNGIFISCAIRNNTFYAGPDYSKRFCEIGNDDIGSTNGVGIKYLNRFVHRVFGSEVRWANNDKVHEIQGRSYTEPIRRKIYDETLPSLGLTDGSGSFSGYRVLTWRDVRASNAEFEAF